jgi:hypothetical protein
VTSPPTTRSSDERWARGIAIGVAFVVVIRVLWYLEVVDVGYPFIPARDDQADRQRIVNEIRTGGLLSPTFIGSDNIRLPVLEADLSIGGEIEVDRDAVGVLTVVFWTQGGILGELAGYAYTSDGHEPMNLSDPDMVPHPLGGGWFTLG